MPGDINLIRFAAVFADMRVHPVDRGTALPHLLVQAHAGDQRVIDDDVDEPGAGEAERHIGAILLVVADPVTAVNVDLHRRKATCLLGPENIEPLARAGVIGHIECAGQGVARPRALFDPAGTLALQPFFADLEPVVVLAVERRLIVVAKDGDAHGSPLGWPANYALIFHALHRRLRREPGAAVRECLFAGFLPSAGDRTFRVGVPHGVPVTE